MEEIIIRHSEPKDIVAIKEICEGKLAAAATLQLPFVSVSLWETRLAKLQEGAYSLVAEMNNEVVGQIGFYIFQNTRRKHAASFGMAVKDSCHRKGIGSKLLQAAIDLSGSWLTIKRIEITAYTDNKSA